jgi:hypothetical protein
MSSAMGRQWLRKWQLSSGGVTISGDLRIVFEVKSWVVEAPNNGTFKIYNLAVGTAAAFQVGQTVTFSAGYQDNSGEIFTGSIVQVNKGKDNATDTTTTIYATQSDPDHNYGHVNTTLQAGSTGMDVFKALLKAMPGLQQGDIPTQALQALRYPRSITLTGMARHHLHTLAHSIDSVFHYDAVKPLLHITQNNNDQGIGSPIVLNASTGMIGLPTQDASGVNVRCLLNPQIQKRSLIHIDQKSIQSVTPDLSIGGAGTIGSQFARGDTTADGVYRVVYLEQVGDSRGDPWFVEANCIAVTGRGPTSAQVNAGTP